MSRANKDFSKVYASPRSNPFELLRSAPCKGKGSVTPHRLSTLVGKVRYNLQMEQTAALQADLATQLVSGPQGRKSTFLFATMARPCPRPFAPPAFAEGRKTQELSPFYRRCIDRVRYGDMPTPVKPSHNYRQTHAIRQAGVARRRAQKILTPTRPIGATVHAPPRVVITEAVQAQRRAVRLASAEARLCAEATPAPPCTLCGMGVPDAFHLTFDCPSTLTQREHILAAIRIRAQTDPELYRMTYRASDQDLLLASIGGTPFRHIRPDSPAYSNLVRLTAPNWASQFKGVYT
jgi:hypothetical protein